MIAATARALGATLATRNVRDFADCGLTLVDPLEPRLKGSENRGASFRIADCGEPPLQGRQRHRKRGTGLGDQPRDVAVTSYNTESK